MHERFSTRSTLEHQFHRIFERYSFTPWRIAKIEIMVLLEFKTNVEFVEDTPLLTLYKTLQLIGLQPPMKDEPTSLRVTRSPQAHKRMIIQLIQNLTNRIQPYARLRRNLVVRSLLRILQNINQPDSIFLA
jgi:hypothetical protein